MTVNVVTSNPTVVSVKKPTIVISKAQIDSLIAAQTAKTISASVAKKAEENFKKQLVALFDALFGIKSEDEIKALDPDTLNSLFVDGINKEFILEEDFEIALSKKGRYPSWASEFIKVASQSKAQEIIDNTPEQYSYKIVKS